MKMLTLWACVEASDSPLQSGVADSSLSWKHAWHALSHPAKPATNAAPEKCTRRQSVT
jgi:hypothetical protein